MKKYLMTGIAALTMCFGFTSCSHDLDTLSQEEIDQRKANEIVENYKKAFVAQFGQPAADQDWGFGTSAMTRSANTEHNQWAAVDNIYKLLVPPALTPGQIQRVKIYFQYNRYLTYEDPHLTDFFVQQVYEGSTDPGTLSSEVYTSGNGARVVAGDHMDKLTVGVNETHVNDFNSADCGESTVLNNGTKQNNYVPDGTTHQDKITLMQGESTEYVGFWCSEGSVQHNDCCALAGAQTIDDWATSAAVVAWAAENNIDLGSTVVDGWDRSFVGLDYEQVSPEDLFRQKYVYPEGNRSEVKVWDFCSDTNNTKKVKLNGQLVDANTVANDQLFFPNGEPVKWVDDNTNMYLGQNLGTNQNTFNKQENGVKYYDLDAVYACINQGAYPKVNNMEFIKGLGGRDYVFSDWIVTLTPAKKFTTQTPPPSDDIYTVRVIAEDLTYGQDLDTDFDFNDVVFDVCLKANETKIKLKAAGGTLPLIIGVENPDNNQNYLSNEVHNLFGEAVNVMINTHAEKKGLPNASKPDYVLTLNTAYSNARDIPVYVKKSGTWVELTAIQGEPASKIGVDISFQWIDERTSLKGSCPLFVDWVQATAEFRDQIKWW